MSPIARIVSLAGLALAFALPAAAQAPDAAQTAQPVSQEAKSLAAACDNGKMSACVHLGILHRYGIGAPQDPRAAVTLYVEACEKGFALACAFTGDMAYLGAGVSRSPEHGEILMRRACSQNNEWACETLKRYGLVARNPES